MNWKKKNGIISLAVMLTQLMGAVVLAAPEENFPATMTVNQESKSFTLRFKSNRTTGYRWFLAKYDRHLLQPLSYSYEVPSVAMMGASGVSVWTFQVRPAAKLVPGITTITWIYARSWEKPDKTQKHVVTIYFLK